MRTAKECGVAPRGLLRGVDDDRDGLGAPVDAREERIEIVVAQIKRLARSASLEFALRVGAVIIHHFYDGNPNAWRSSGPKTTSFRRLAAHPELPLSAGSLCRCVALFELCDRLNAPGRSIGRRATFIGKGIPMRCRFP